MRILAMGVALLLLVAACSATDPWRAEAATAIGDELSGRLAGPLALAADTADDTDLDALKNALDAALDDMTLPPGVYRIVPGGASSSYDGGYSSVSLPIVVVPTDSESIFCMVLALSSTGELVAEPALGDPLDRCRDTETNRLTQP